jgi:hypothetical protein
LEGQDSSHQILHRLVDHHEEHRGNEAAGLGVFTLVEEEGQAEERHEDRLAHFNSSVHWISFETHFVSPYKHLILITEAGFSFLVVSEVDSWALHFLRFLLNR